MGCYTNQSECWGSYGNITYEEYPERKPFDVDLSTKTKLSPMFQLIFYLFGPDAAGGRRLASCNRSELEFLQRI